MLTCPPVLSFSVFLSITHFGRQFLRTHVTNPNFYFMFSIFISSLTLRNTCSFFARLVKVTFTVFLQHRIWKNPKGKKWRITTWKVSAEINTTGASALSFFLEMLNSRIIISKRYFNTHCTIAAYDCNRESLSIYISIWDLKSISLKGRFSNFTRSHLKFNFSFSFSSYRPKSAVFLSNQNWVFVLNVQLKEKSDRRWKI
jgi:hypothetical protein